MQYQSYRRVLLSLSYRECLCTTIVGENIKRKLGGCIGKVINFWLGVCDLKDKVTIKTNQFMI